ncbi:MAG TPA: TA system VapC family ribonuclease toxin [Luteolibacter sp.]
MSYLLDVNVLLAWGWSDHVDHRRVAAWIATVKQKRGIKLFTSAIPELGFVRISVQRGGGRLKVADASEVLASMLRSLGARHEFLPDDLSSAEPFPAWCLSAPHTTDGHLLALANRHGFQLATLDTGIPSAFLIPSA